MRNIDSAHPMNRSLPKSQRLSGKKEISELFEKGSFFYLKPFRVYFASDPGKTTEAIEFLVTAPKSKFPAAVDRNLIKRRTREAFRNSQEELADRLTTKGINLKKLGLVYVEEELFSFSHICSSLMKIPEKMSSYRPKK